MLFATCRRGSGGCATQMRASTQKLLGEAPRMACRCKSLRCHSSRAHVYSLSAHRHPPCWCLSVVEVLCFTIILHALLCSAHGFLQQSLL